MLHVEEEAGHVGNTVEEDKAKSMQSKDGAQVVEAAVVAAAKTARQVSVLAKDRCWEGP